jgi:glycosyltransferase involved in cell wall biosynthesis
MGLHSQQQAKPVGSSPEISVVIPLFNEAENILPLYHALRLAMEDMGCTWEVVFVDDGSTDTTFQVLGELHVQYEGVCVVRLRRNFGQTAAMVAGFDHAYGKTIVTLDGDLQNDPKDIASVLKKLDEGYDVVSGWRVKRQEAFWRRRLPSHVANWLISRATGTRLHDYGCTLKAYRAETIRELRLYGEMHRFIPALLGSNGARITELPVHHAPRRAGRSKYGLSRIIRVLLDLLTVKFLISFLTRPLQIFGLVGLVTFLPGMAICVYLTLLRLFWGYPLTERPLLFFGILCSMVGVQFICMGILAEIQTRTYHESIHKPIYAIQEILDVQSPRSRLSLLKRNPNGDTPIEEYER